MEDSPNLSKYGEHLMKAVETGVRKNFVGISGMQISEVIDYRYYVDAHDAIKHYTSDIIFPQSE